MPTVRRWWLGTTWARLDCQHLLTVSSLISSGPCICPHRGERWPPTCEPFPCSGAPREGSSCLLLPENEDQNNTWHKHWKEHWCWTEAIQEIVALAHSCPPRWCLLGSGSNPHSTQPGRPTPWRPAGLPLEQFASSWPDRYRSLHTLGVFQGKPG